LPSAKEAYAYLTYNLVPASAAGCIKTTSALDETSVLDLLTS